jgi:hypothetical protein
MFDILEELFDDSPILDFKVIVPTVISFKPARSVEPELD